MTDISVIPDTDFRFFPRPRDPALSTGVRRLRAALAAAGHRVGHQRVDRLMRLAGLRGCHPKARKRTTVHGDKPVNAPDLIGRSFTAAEHNQKWCGDITYVATVIDLHSRAIVGYAVADHMRTSLVTDARDMAIATRTPAPDVIFHSDRGTQYAEYPGGISPRLLDNAIYLERIRGVLPRQ